MDTILSGQEISLYDNDHSLHQESDSSSEHDQSENPTVFVQLEIQAHVLQRLLDENNLFIEELHCLNTDSKATVWHLILHSLRTYQPYRNI